MFKNKKVISILLAGALVSVLALGAMVAVPVITALAADGDDDAVETPDVAFTRPDGFARMDGRGGRGGPRDGGDTYLAEALGITADDLQAAIQQAREEMQTTWDAFLAAALGISVDELENAQGAAKEAALEQALADGKITEEDLALREAREALGDYLDRDKIVAQALGISVDELAADREEGTRTADLMDELGIDEETYKANLEVAYEETLNQAVEDGILTQEQADLLMEAGFNGGLVGHGRGGRPHGGPRGDKGDFEGMERPSIEGSTESQANE